MFGGGYCGAMGAGGWLLMIGFWGVLIAAVIWAATRWFPTAERRSDATDALDRRLATGEIDVETYHATRAELAAARR